MTETELIRLLTADLPVDDSVLIGAGDDCAVIRNGANSLLLKTDAIVEGVHFEKDVQPEAIGRKALARPLSDIAAMAGTPTHALITLGSKSDHDPGHLKAVYDGLNQCATEHGVNLVGGETTTLPCLTLSIALLGTVQNPILRTGSAVGDAIFVSGELGGSLAGHHLDFTPRLKEARWLSDQDIVHAINEGKWISGVGMVEANPARKNPSLEEFNKMNLTMIQLEYKFVIFGNKCRPI